MMKFPKNDFGDGYETGSGRSREIYFSSNSKPTNFGRNEMSAG
jgi:hypothetical protein